MAFTKGRGLRLALCVATSLVASTAVGQAYQQQQQPAAPAAPPRYPTQPASYPYAAPRPQAQPGPGQPQPAAAPGPSQPAVVPMYNNPPYNTPAYNNATAAAPAAGTAAPGGYGVPPSYGAQPTTGAQPAAGAQPMYAAPARPSPYPSAQVSNPIRRAGFDQPIDGQQPAAAAQPDAAATATQQPAAQPVSQSTVQPTPTASSSASQSGQSAPSSTPPTTVPADVLAGRTANEHELAPAIRWAREGYKNCDKLQDYSCTLVKRERIDGVLGEHEYAFVKVRHRPFSVYMYFLGPAKVKGREALFVQGQNEGNLLAHDNGIRHRMIGTVSLKPTSPFAISGNRYPITEMGMRRLLERLIEIGDNDMKYGECKVQWITGAKVDGRVCTCIQVVHPVPRRNFLFHLARIYVDDELQLPIRYEAYDWPARQGEAPQLTEEYTFLKVKVNNGFTDADFSVENPAYGFK